MKFGLSILCSLLLLWAQVAVASAPVTAPAAHDCGCGGRMACCHASPARPAAPLDATVVIVSAHQILSPIPATVVWVLPAAGTFSISPTVPSSLTAAVAPLFARNCVRLI